MLELCLILPVLLLLLLGTIEFGRAAYFDIEVADAARAGALYGAQSMADAADTGAITQAVQNNAQDIPTAQTTITSSVSCTCPGSGTVGTGGNCLGVEGCTPQVYVTVQVTDIQPTLFQYPGIPDPFTLSSTSVMPVRTQ
jgi:Flp pilus assembly protein TadG